MQAIREIQAKRYSHFDGLTTTACCHGVALRVHELIKSLDISDLSSVERDVNRSLFTRCLLEINPKTTTQELNIPINLAHLSKFLILHMIRKENKNRGGVITSSIKLREIAPISKKKCSKIIKRLQRKCSTEVAASYQDYLATSKDILVNSLPASLWGKYIKPPFLRANHNNVLYASNLFSMEVVLAHLIKTESVVALVCDLKDASGEIVKGRFVKLFKGNGQDNFTPLSDEEASSLDSSLPVVVLGGCTHSDELNIEGFPQRLSPWMDNLTGLILANDIYYPQFPKVRNDTNFDGSAIVPEEPELKTVIQEHSSIDGISAADPSRFVLAHFYLASLQEVREDSLPLSFISKNIKDMSPNAELLEAPLE